VQPFCFTHTDSRRHRRLANTFCPKCKKSCPVPNNGTCTDSECNTALVKFKVGDLVINLQNDGMLAVIIETCPSGGWFSSSKYKIRFLSYGLQDIKCSELDAVAFKVSKMVHEELIWDVKCEGGNVTLTNPNTADRRCSFAEFANRTAVLTMDTTSMACKAANCKRGKLYAELDYPTYSSDPDHSYQNKEARTILALKGPSNTGCERCNLVGRLTPMIPIAGECDVVVDTLQDLKDWWGMYHYVDIDRRGHKWEIGHHNTLGKVTKIEGHEITMASLPLIKSSYLYCGTKRVMESMHISKFDLKNVPDDAMLDKESTCNLSYFRCFWKAE